MKLYAFSAIKVQAAVPAVNTIQIYNNMNAQSLPLVLSAAILPLLIQAKPNGAQRDGDNARQPPSIEQVFARLDANASGGISVDEAEGPLEGHFDQMQTNGEITSRAQSIKS